MRRFFWLAALPLCILPLAHPYGDVRRQRHPATAPVPPRVQQACGNCHSEQTEWPLYSYLPVVSWMIERDVAEARRHMNFARWDRYSPDQRRDFFTRIGLKVRSRQMPPARYLALHPEARFSDADIRAISDWAKAQRRDPRNRRE